MVNRKGQATIFVIIGIVLVVAISLFFVLSRGSVKFFGQEFSPDTYLDTCIRSAVREQSANILDYGGFVNSEDSLVYDGLPVAYLCKNVNDYKSCVVQYPRLIYQIEREIESSISQQVKSCVDNLKEELDRRNFDSQIGTPSSEVILKPDVIEVKTELPLRISSGELISERKSFVSTLSSPVYNLAFLANEIVAQESKFCYFEYVGFGLLYPRFTVNVYRYSDYSKVYSIEDKQTGERMRFAVRGCAVPGGF